MKLLWTCVLLSKAMASASPYSYVANSPALPTPVLAEETGFGGHSAVPAPPVATQIIEFSNVPAPPAVESPASPDYHTVIPPATLPPSNGPAIPSLSEVPAQPSVSEIPAQPSVTEAPVQPTIPEIPALPTIPSVPVPPSVTGVPAQPVIPGMPGIPAVPEVPAQPSVTEVPAVPSVPAQPVETVVPEIPAQPVNTVSPALPVPGYQANQPSTPAPPSVTFVATPPPSIPSPSAPEVVPSVPSAAPSQPAVPPQPTQPPAQGEIIIEFLSVSSAPQVPAATQSTGVPAIPAPSTCAEEEQSTASVGTTVEQPSEVMVPPTPLTSQPPAVATEQPPATLVIEFTELIPGTPSVETIIERSTPIASPPSPQPSAPAPSPSSSAPGVSSAESTCVEIEVPTPEIIVDYTGEAKSQTSADTIVERTTEAASVPAPMPSVPASQPSVPVPSPPASQPSVPGAPAPSTLAPSNPISSAAQPSIVPPAMSTPVEEVDTLPPVYTDETECVEIEESTPTPGVIPPVTVTVTQPAVTVTTTVSEVCVTAPVSSWPAPPRELPPFATQWETVVWEIPLYPFGPGPVIFSTGPPAPAQPRPTVSPAQPSYIASVPRPPVEETLVFIVSQPPQNIPMYPTNTAAVPVTPQPAQPVQTLSITVNEPTTCTTSVVAN